MRLHLVALLLVAGCGSLGTMVTPSLEADLAALRAMCYQIGPAPEERLPRPPTT